MIPRIARDDEEEVLHREVQPTLQSVQKKIERSADASKDRHVLYHDSSNILEDSCFPSKIECAINAVE